VEVYTSFAASKNSVVAQQRWTCSSNSQAQALEALNAILLRQGVNLSVVTRVADVENSGDLITSSIVGSSDKTGSSLTE